MEIDGANDAGKNEGEQRGRHAFMNRHIHQQRQRRRHEEAANAGSTDHRADCNGYQYEAGVCQHGCPINGWQVRHYNSL
jgi:hypothetical protein